MRRNDREITNLSEILEIMGKCDICRLALHDGDYPYILPVNFGMQVEGEQITLYFHGSSKGRKHELIAQNPHASFEMDCSHELVSDAEKGSCTMHYESVIGHGLIEPVPEEEKLQCLEVLMDHYHKDPFPYDKTLLPVTTVLRLKVESITAKRYLG